MGVACEWYTYLYKAQELQLVRNVCEVNEVSTFLVITGAAAAAKKWRGLINIHDLDCTMLHARIFERVD